MAPSTTLTKTLIQAETEQQLFLCLTLETPSHNLKNRKFQVFIAGELQEGDYIKLLGSFACLCEPRSVISSRNSSSSLDGNVSSLTDTFIDPLTRIITTQSAITPKEVVPSSDGKKLSIKLGSYGKNQGKSQIKFVALVFEISFNGQFYNSYITMKTQRGISALTRTYTNKESCFISDAVQNQQDEFIEALFNYAFSCRLRKQTPQTITDEGLNFLEGNADSYDFGEKYMFSDVIFSKIHSEFGPKEGGQSNVLYLSFKDSSKTDLFKLLQNHSQSISMYFLLQEHPEVQVGIPQLIHINCIGFYVAIHFITTPVISNIEGDLKTWVFLTINNEAIDGQVEYTFVDSKKKAEEEQL